LSPLFERFFVLGGPGGIRQKKFQNLESLQLRGGLSGISFSIFTQKPSKCEAIEIRILIASI